ncbi:MAG TPA: heme exporter protein CcmD [Steroidobacteraceae bacterium]|jgi:heme exporter protein CcmD|nr:heme exporter protein CcmD [Steroidobacteraceae bacterium]
MMIQFHTMAQFLAMGKYAAYVWPSYGLTLLAVVLNIVWARRLLRQARVEARRRLAMQEERV